MLPDFQTSQELTEKIRLAVERVRQELFGSPQPPFATLEEAMAWLQQTVAAQEAPAQTPAPYALKQTILETLAQYRALTGEPVGDPFVPEHLDYVEPGNPWVRRLPVYEGTSLATLRNTSKRLADATGFTPVSAVAYLLTGIPPLLASVNIDLSTAYSGDFDIFRQTATVTLRTPDITDAQWRAVRRSIRRAWHPEKKKPVPQRDTQLRDLMQRYGGVPKDRGHGEQKAFWEQVQREYNSWATQHGGAPHKEWRITRQACKRLLEKDATGTSHDGEASSPDGSL
jgi:hypothetical protein